MKIAVTGATGFIGKHVLAELERHDVEVVSIVRSSSSKVIESTKARVVQVDMYKAPTNMFELMGHPDALIHLAWNGLPNYKSLHHFETELPAQFRFLKALIESGLSSLVVAGTCFEYGMQSGVLNETLETRPSNPYGFAKDMLRRQLGYLKQTNPFALTWARLFYLYGEGQADSSLLPQLKKAVERGDKVFNMSGGEQLRDYFPVSEIAKRLVALALVSKDVGAINVCSGQPISVRRLVESWIKENDWTISLNLGYYAYPDYEPMAFWGDAQKLCLLIGETK